MTGLTTCDDGERTYRQGVGMNGGIACGGELHTTKGGWLVNDSFQSRYLRKESCKRSLP